MTSPKLGFKKYFWLSHRAKKNRSATWIKVNRRFRSSVNVFLQRFVFLHFDVWFLWQRSTKTKNKVTICDKYSTEFCGTHDATLKGMEDVDPSPQSHLMANKYFSSANWLNVHTRSNQLYLPGHWPSFAFWFSRQNFEADSDSPTLRFLTRCVLRKRNWISCRSCDCLFVPVIQSEVHKDSPTGEHTTSRVYKTRTIGELAS